MKYLKMIGLAAVAAAAMTAYTAGTALATTLEINGVIQGGAVAISAEATAGAVLARTDGTVGNTCTESKFAGTTSVFTGEKVTAPLSLLSFKKCTTESVVVDNGGQIYIEWDGYTNGNVFSENAKVTVPTGWGFSVTCETGIGTKVGTLTGVSGGNHATLHINAVLDCGFLLRSATLKGTYKVTSPTGFGVVQ